MAQMNLTPLSEVVDDVWGKKGSPERDAMEARLKEDLQAYMRWKPDLKKTCRLTISGKPLSQSG